MGFLSPLCSSWDPRSSRHSDTRSLLNNKDMDEQINREAPHRLGSTQLEGLASLETYWTIRGDPVPPRPAQPLFWPKCEQFYLFHRLENSSSEAKWVAQFEQWPSLDAAPTSQWSEQTLGCQQCSLSASPKISQLWINKWNFHIPEQGENCPTKIL